jgi:hypothetical protein
MSAVVFPEEKKFAFSLLSGIKNVPAATLRPVYRLLEELGLRCTQVVSSFAAPQGAGCSLDDSEFREFIVELNERGFEIGWAGACAESSERARTIEGLERFREVIGRYPRVYVNHALRRENLYWGNDRIDQPLLKAVLHRAAPTPSGYFQGHLESSAFWWGDVCQQRLDYVLNLTFDDVNLTRINPSMPYHDPSRPSVRYWFSASDAADCSDFNQLLRPDRQQKLERDGGYCIVATDLSRGFVRNHEVERLARKRFEALAARPGWFVPVSTLLDHLRSAQTTEVLSGEEWDRMQWKWARDIVRRRRREDGRGRELIEPGNQITLGAR